jgi:hypothetical protein
VEVDRETGEVETGDRGGGLGWQLRVVARKHTLPYTHNHTHTTTHTTEV